MPTEPDDRFAACFEALHERSEGLLMPFLPIGFPSTGATLELVDKLVSAGADAVELGLPFSDPVADGPVLQAASAAAIEQGVTPSIGFDTIASIRARHPRLPIAVLTYLNLVEAPGPAAFFQRAARAGVDAVVLADLPCCEAAPYVAIAREAGTRVVLLVAPDTPPTTIRQVAKLSGGFTYVVARRGITGARTGLPTVAPAVLDQLKAAGAPPPVVGFGLSTGAHLEAVLRAGAAGGIVGSAFVKRLADEGPAAAVALIRACKAGTRPAPRASVARTC
jgi:tryptophan synthase alpha chain